MPVERSAGLQHRLVVGVVGPDDHLRALPRGRELAAVLLGFLDPFAHLSHGGADRRPLLLRRQRLQAAFRRQFQIDRQAVGPQARLLDQPRARLGNGLEVDVTAKAVLAAERPGDRDELLHGVVRRADDAGGQEQAFDVVALVEFQREGHDLLHREARPLDVRGAPVHAISAIEQAVIRQKDLQAATRSARPACRRGKCRSRSSRAPRCRRRASARRRRRRTRRIWPHRRECGACGRAWDPSGHSISSFFVPTRFWPGQGPANGRFSARQITSGAGSLTDDWFETAALQRRRCPLPLERRLA